jgi:hypothetical protein
MGRTSGESGESDVIIGGETDSVGATAIPATSPDGRANASSPGVSCRKKKETCRDGCAIVSRP